MNGACASLLPGAAAPCWSRTAGAQAGRCSSVHGKSHSAACWSWQELILAGFDRPLRTDTLCPAQANRSRNLLGVFPNFIFCFKNSLNYFLCNLPWAQTADFSLGAHRNHDHSASPPPLCHAKKQLAGPEKVLFSKSSNYTQKSQARTPFLTSSIQSRRGRTRDAQEHATRET